MNYFREEDFNRLTNDDIKKLEKEIDDIKKIKGNKKGWISNNI